MLTPTLPFFDPIEHQTQPLYLPLRDAKRCHFCRCAEFSFTDCGPWCCVVACHYTDFSCAARPFLLVLVSVPRTPPLKKNFAEGCGRREFFDEKKPRKISAISAKNRGKFHHWSARRPASRGPGRLGGGVCHAHSLRPCDKTATVATTLVYVSVFPRHQSFS